MFMEYSHDLMCGMKDMVTFIPQIILTESYVKFKIISFFLKMSVSTLTHKGVELSYYEHASIISALEILHSEGRKTQI